MGLSSFIHPLLIFPFVSVHIPYNRGRIRAELCIVCIGIRLQHRFAGFCLYFIFIEHPSLKLRNKKLIDPGVPKPFHLVPSAVP